MAHPRYPGDEHSHSSGGSAETSPVALLHELAQVTWAQDALQAPHSPVDPLGGVAVIPLPRKDPGGTKWMGDQEQTLGLDLNLGKQPGHRHPGRCPALPGDAPRAIGQPPRTLPTPQIPLGSLRPHHLCREGRTRNLCLSWEGRG